MGSVSREQIFEHFSEVHGAAAAKLTPYFKCLKNFIICAKWGLETVTNCLIVGKTTTDGDMDTSQIFLVSGKTTQNSQLIRWQIYQLWRSQEETDDDEVEDYEGEHEADEYIMDLLFMLEPRVKSSRISLFSSSNPSWNLSDCQACTKNSTKVSIRFIALITDLAK